MADKHTPPPQTSPPPARRSFGLVDHRAHWEHLKRHLPPWKQKLLAVSLIIGVLGFGAQLTSRILRRDAPVSTANLPLRQVPAPTPAAAPPAGGSGFVSGAPQPMTPPPPAVPSTPTPTTGQTLTDTVTPWMGKLGVSFFVGVVLGTMFRAFVKLAVMFALLVGGGFAALSYFHIVNVDMTTVKTHTASASAWIADQGDKLKDVAVSALPSSSSALAGFFAGFKRR